MRMAEQQNYRRITMHNAHLRMGRLEYLKAATHAKSVPTHITLSMDRIIAEPSLEPTESPRCHLLSVFGGEQEIGAISAAIAEEARLTVSGPGFDARVVTLGERPQVFRGSLQIPGRKQSVRHLVAVSQEFSETQAGLNTTAERTILYDQEPHFLAYRLGVRFGVPVLPDWSAWIADNLGNRHWLQELPGLGCHPVLVTANKQALLALLASGLRNRELVIPDGLSAIDWKVPVSFVYPAP
jgi:hypothetical protein